jgi:glucose-1-phosphate cytidylyltransferase
MKAVILAGGLGTRISEETTVATQADGRDRRQAGALAHHQDLYSHHGINDFVICLGYKGYMIKEYFANYFLHNSDVTFDMSTNRMQVHHKHAEPWRVTLGRYRRPDPDRRTSQARRRPTLTAKRSASPTATDWRVDIDVAPNSHSIASSKRKATVCAVQPPGRFGSIDIDGSRITRFEEKPIGDGTWINGGFFVLEPAGAGLHRR